ncbi:MAG TPA: urate oxidase, partial [Candidatus Obscuribacterales bacterium]
DNSKVVATDSMKNTVYVLAAENPLSDIESFAKTLCSHFLTQYEHVAEVEVRIEEDLWMRIEHEGREHAHAFVSAGKEKRTTLVYNDRKALTITSGIEDLVVLKTTASEFWGFIRDRYTTLPEARDRIFATTVQASWPYGKGNQNFNACYENIRNAILNTFARHHSLSVQQTLYEMGEEALKVCPEIDEITIALPNQHRIPFNLSPFGLENKNEIFVPTEEPYGLITGTIRRK